MNSGEKAGIFLISASALGLATLFAWGNTRFDGSPTPMGNLVAWLPLASGFIGSAVLYWYSTGIYWRLVSTISFAGVFSSYFFFHEVYGSDAGGIVATLWKMDHSQSASAMEGSSMAWPAFYLLAHSIQEVGGVQATDALRVIMLAMVAVLSLAFIGARRGETAHQVAPIVVFLVPFYALMNWQAAPQVLAFIALVLFFAFTKNGPRYYLVGVAIFLFITFSHGFVGLWFIGALALSLYLDRTQPHETKHRDTRLGLLGSAMIIESAYLVFYAPAYLRTFSNILTETFLPSQTGGETVATTSGYVGLGLLNWANNGVLEIATKICALLSIALILVLMILGLRRWVKAKDTTTTERSLIAVGAIHMGLGSIVSVLGIRGIQPAAFSTARIPNCVQVLSRRTVLTIIVISLFLFPANVIRINSESTLYLDNQDIATVTFHDSMISSIPEGRNCIIGPGEITSTISIGSVNWSTFQIRFPPDSADLEFEACYLIYSPEYERELEFYTESESGDLNDLTLLILDEGALFFDSGEDQFYVWNPS